MSISAFAASAPAGQWPVVLLEIPDLNGGAPLRYANDLADWTVTLEGALGSATFPAVGHRVDGSDVDDSVTESRAVAVPDEEGILWARIVANIGGAGPMLVVVRLYSSDDLSAPLIVRTLELIDAQQSADGMEVSFSAKSLDPINRDAGLLEFTEANAPGLRGRT